MSWELSTNENYTYFTNTVDDSLSIRYPGKDIFYRESPNAIDIMQKFDRATMAVITKADISSPVFADNAALIDWMDANTGGSSTVLQVTDVSNPKDIMLSIPKGDIVGYSSVNKFGENADSPKDERADVWDNGGIYPFPTTADITHLHQVSDQAALRGGTIQIQGLDANWDLIVQDTNLNASNTSTPVVLATPLIRVFRLKVMANVVSNSDIHVNNIGDTIQYATMTAGNNQTLMAIYTVPRGKTAYMTRWFGSMILGLGKEPKGANFRLWTADRDNGYEFQLKCSEGVQKGASPIDHHYEPYLKITQKTDIKLDCYCYDNPGTASAGFDLILVDD